MSASSSHKHCVSNAEEFSKKIQWERTISLPPRRYDDCSSTKLSTTFSLKKAVRLTSFLALQVANRMKSKGLQKLRWYCQMCQKQCRDENGFKCHLTSESHKRQMMVFGANPTRGEDVRPAESMLRALLKH